MLLMIDRDGDYPLTSYAAGQVVSIAGEFGSADVSVGIYTVPDDPESFEPYPNFDAVSRSTVGEIRMGKGITPFLRIENANAGTALVIRTGDTN